MTKLMKALLPLNPLIAAAINFIIVETARISKCSKLNSLLKSRMSIKVVKYLNVTLKIVQLNLDILT